MNQRFSRDLAMLLELELERKQRVRAVLAAYEELTEEEKALFRLAAGISQDGTVTARRTGRRASKEENDELQPGRLQPLVRGLMKTLLEDYPSLLTGTDIENLMDRNYTQNTLGLQIGGFPLLRRREVGRRGSDNDGQSRYYAKLYGGRYYICSQWWRDDHLDNARSLLQFVENLADRNRDHPGTTDLEHHKKGLIDYLGRTQ